MNSTMTTIDQVSRFLDSFAPTRIAEEWDNVGLLVGDPEQEVKKIMTCLTVTPESSNEAIERQANLIVTHHPLPFRPIKKITTTKTPTRLLWQLINNGISIYSPHTGFDSATNGINQSVCERIGLTNIEPLQPFENDPDRLGSGRVGVLKKEVSCNEFVDSLKNIYGLDRIRYVSGNATVARVASACGSGGSFLSSASKAGCDTLITGEADFHSCLEASALTMNLILLGHYASERFAVDMLAGQLRKQFNDLNIWASEKESDPIIWA